MILTGPLAQEHFRTDRAIRNLYLLIKFSSILGPRNSDIIWNMALRFTGCDVLPRHFTICSFKRRVLRDSAAIDFTQVNKA